ncbi:hypothetical protein BSL82_02450 [Tardibacter chloracetimidivorans]|uniref:DUF4326 domain-containing protein n=1 Tax=Tardibacter chloracetimidivorans TaxID=1921510 RepID=A0A1L3ZRR0_9SPHN|nr:DUF4326 domain-containing protein [Tardibacter chloracetimidivorans]API58308.1 hypothetical protein BSL82_02450 [Tardibacter chloracetimidivorans]
MTPRRIKRGRTLGWRMPENTVTVDRRTKWGNPFNLKASEHCWTALACGCKGDPAGRQRASVILFREWINNAAACRIQDCGLYAEREGERVAFATSPAITAPQPPAIEDIQAELRGRNLACWCKLCEAHQDGLPLGVQCDQCAPCHADVLLEIANR